MGFVSTDNTEVRDLARSIAEKHLTDPPGALTDDAFSRSKVEALAKAGFLGMGLPQSLGGGGASAVDLVLVTEELARVSTSAAFVFSAQNGLAARAIATYGTTEMHDKYIPGILDGSILTAWAMSEPGGGSDVARLRTQARSDGEEVVLNGEKTWISMAEHAGVFVVIARFDGIEGMAALGAIVVDRDTPGLEVGPHISTMGINGSGMASVFMDDCRVPVGDVIVPAGGYKTLLGIMSGERIVSNPPISLGLAGAAFDAAIDHLTHREAFGQTLGDFQGLRWRIAELAIQLEAARLLVYQAAFNADQGNISIAEAAMAKIAANEAAVRITDAAVQIHGASGYTKEMGVERLARDARGMAIGDGTVEIQRNLLAATILRSRTGATR